jgi:alpha-tubulin suppressor-like RCC1 family protein
MQTGMMPGPARERTGAAGWRRPAGSWRGRGAGRWLTAGAAALVLAGCASGQPGGSSSAPARPLAATHPAATRPAAAPVPSGPPVPVAERTVRHWGSFFDDANVSADMQDRPAAVILPGAIRQVGSSNSSEYALLTDGTLWAWGLGGEGELGNGLLTSSFTQPVQVAFPAGVKIAWIPTDVMPYDTALAVDTAGHVWGWGDNAIGELCLGNHDVQSTPVELPFSDVTAAAGAADHDLYDAGGTVWACGQNVDGDLGDGQTANSDAPVRVAGLNGRQVIRLVTSFANSGALLSDGRYYDWGYNADGQLGDGEPGRWSDVPVRVFLPGRVAQVALGGSIWGNGQTLVKLADGSLWDWGSNYAYQLGIAIRGWQPSPVRFYAPPGVTYQALATGSATAYAISTTGNVYAWGLSTFGQAGTGSVRLAVPVTHVASGAALISATANNVVISDPGPPGAAGPPPASQ